MTPSKPIPKICRYGHKFYKSSSCPICPICEKQKKVAGFLSLVSAPARRALESKNITTLKKLAGFSEKELLQLHGFGPSAMPKLKAALKKEGLKFKK